MLPNAQQKENPAILIPMCISSLQFRVPPDHDPETRVPDTLPISPSVSAFADQMRVEPWTDIYVHFFPFFLSVSGFPSLDHRSLIPSNIQKQIDRMGNNCLNRWVDGEVLVRNGRD